MSSSPEPRSTAPAPKKQSWLLKGLDFPLSEPLRRASPAELIRHRVFAGSACFLSLLGLAYTLSALFSGLPALLGVLTTLCYLGSLVMARRATTIKGPALLLLGALSIGVAGSTFVYKNAGGGMHASAMLLPALAVYLLGPRLGLLITGFLTATLCVGYAFYYTHLGLPTEPLSPSQFWTLRILTGLCFLGAWLLGWLHSTARDESQRSVERTLKELRDRESQLGSVIESTDDLVLSLDTQGRVITANSAARFMYQKRSSQAIELGQPLLRQGPPELLAAWDQRVAQVLQGQRLQFEEEYLVGDVRVVMDLRINPIAGEDGRPAGLTIFGRDITARKEAETRLGEMHRTLVDVSRQAGMAEIATGVLHNVGNTLNSVNISTNIVTESLRKSRIAGLAKATSLLRENATDISSFLSADPQGKKLPGYLIALSDQLQEERESLLQEMQSLSESVDHIKSIVSMQQKHARAAGAVEQVAVPQLIDEALRLHAVSFERLGIHIERDYAPVPQIHLDRHKLLQILINLLSNARHALVASQKPDKQLRIRVRQDPEQGLLRIEVLDNGLGIDPENLPRLFTQGFTTKKEGHGFGLHISALAASEMKGRLTCSSPGPGQGATFTFELPLDTEGGSAQEAAEQPGTLPAAPSPAPESSSS